MATENEVQQAITNALNEPRSFSSDGERVDARSADELARLVALNAAQQAANSSPNKRLVISNMYMRIRPNGSV